MVDLEREIGFAPFSEINAFGTKVLPQNKLLNGMQSIRGFCASFIYFHGVCAGDIPNVSATILE